MPNSPIRIIATNDIRDALRDHFILIVTVFLSLAALSALVNLARHYKNVMPSQ
ncbi:hypothetical protein [Pseudorhodobacter sp.]|uniref:hypothetical protein n=1 Tax=Pseudorhodobacter sp. TaxID=1934400 RepID=UPI002647E8B7|nr:hypothetical protein [Pseudorhodobacter sp.]MDN5786811.1 hypothetical protein [Pseudorhodobacter sp.]